MRSDTVSCATIDKHHILGLLDAGHRLHIAVHTLVGHVYDARGAEDVPVGVECGGAGVAGGVVECERGFEAGAREDGEDFTGAVQVAAFVACELLKFDICSVSVS